MFKRLFPNLAKIPAEGLMGLIIIGIFVWLFVAATAENYFIAQNWIHEAKQ